MMFTFKPPLPVYNLMGDIVFWYYFGALAKPIRLSYAIKLQRTALNTQQAKSIKSNSKTVITGSYIVSTRAPHNISMLLAHHLILIVNCRLIRSTHPVPHRRCQSLGAVGLVLHRSSRSIGQDILAEPTASAATIRGIDCRSAVTALFQADVAVRGIVVAGADLELHPRSWQLGSALHTPFETCGESNEGTCAGTNGCGVGGMVEVCAGGAVAVPEVVVEIVGLLLG